MRIWNELKDGIEQAAAGLDSMARGKDHRPTYDEWLATGFDRDPNAEVSVGDFTAAEMDAWREGLDPYYVGPQREMPDWEIGG